MAKMALLVGVSEYEPGLNPLPGAVKDVEAMRQMLLHSDMGGFSESDIMLLKNPERQEAEMAIETLFSSRHTNDLVLLYFSGHGIKDDLGSLHLATRTTRKNSKGELIRSTAVSAKFVQQCMGLSRSKRQVVILDSCFSGAFAEGMSAKDDGTIDIRNQLGGEGRVVLTSSSSTQYSFEQQGQDLSIYTRYLLEGIETGEADLDNDGVVSVNELHEYAAMKVQEAQPAMKPEIYVSKEGYKIRIAQACVNDPKLRYRREVQKSAGHDGNISSIARATLDTLRKNLGLSAAEAKTIEDEALDPRREREQSLRQYKHEFMEAILREYPISKQTRTELRALQKALKLEDEDVSPIEAQLTTLKSAAQFQVNQNLEEIVEGIDTSPQDGKVPSQTLALPSSQSSTKFYENHSLIIGLLIATVIGSSAFLYWQFKVERSMRLKAATLQSQHNYKDIPSKFSWIKDKLLFQKIQGVLQQDDLEGARQTEQEMTSPDWKQQANSLIAEKENAIGNFWLQKIQEVLEVNDWNSAREIEQKMPSQDWKQKAQLIIDKKIEGSALYEQQQRELAEQAKREAEVKAQHEAELAERAKQETETARQNNSISGNTQAVLPSPELLTGAKLYNHCFRVTGLGVNIRSDDNLNDQIVGEVVRTVNVGDPVLATEETQVAQTLEDQEMRIWLKITSPVEGWITRGFLEQTTCP
ncbi:MAG TPA: caspase family protein [Trichocoleus sp.]|jgi:uncharacterized caspase-like protein/signal recognition particle subunit SEC65